MRAVTVCVDMADLLRIWLGWNARHFDRVHVVTSPADHETAQAAAACPKASVFATDAFYRRGAAFNKWLALEEALDHFGRHGWLTLADCDTLWPRDLPDFTFVPGRLYTPLRRMMVDLPVPFTLESVPPESAWKRFPVHRNVGEFAGYSQVFHASDPALGPPPWHQTDWAHAGGADSFFQQKWPREKKIRPPFEVLHLGPAGANWMGRVSPRLDGTVPEQAAERAAKLSAVWAGRRARRHDTDPFAHERLPK